MNKNDLQLLRTAALELQESRTDLVRVASIVQQIKNWWKARFSKEFAERQDQVEEAYVEMKGPLNELIGQLTTIEKAFKSQDPDTVAKLVGTVPATIAQVTKDMNILNQRMQAADSAIPVSYIDENGQELSGGNLSWMTSGYKKNKELVQKMIELLPEQFQQIPIGQKINKPITDFEWFAQYEPYQVIISNEVARYAQLELKKALVRGNIEPEIADNIIENGFVKFIENLKVAIIKQSILLQVNFPDVSSKITHRRINEMLVDVQPGYVALPVMSYDFFIHVGLASFNDLGVAVIKDPRLTVYKIRYLSLSAETAKLLKDKWLENRGISNKQNDQDTESEIVEQQLQEPEHVTASGPITNIVKKALLKKCLPTVPAIVKVDGLEFHHKARFAKILSSALRQEIDAECSVRNYGNNVEIQVFALGSKMNVVPAIYGISTYVADEYLKTTKAGIEIDVQYGHSAFETMSSDVLDWSFRKIAFDNWRMS